MNTKLTPHQEMVANLEQAKTIIQTLRNTKENTDSQLDDLEKILSETQAKQKSCQNFKNILEIDNLNVGIFRTSVDGKILNVNRASIKMLGFDSAEELMQFSAMPIYVDLKQRKKLFAKLYEQGEVKNFEAEIRRKDDSIFYASISSILKNDDKGNPLFMDGVIEDITERKQVEATLTQERAYLMIKVEEHTAKWRKANKELVRISRLKDEFLANMSHELRTPLNAILVFSELLLDNIQGQLNEKQRKSLGHINKSGKHLLSLINDILDLSQIEAGQMKLNIEPVQVSTLCQKSIQFVKAAAQKKQIKLFRADDGCVSTLQADERRLKQILSNLLSNAVKFTLKGGKVRLEIIGDELSGVAKFSVIDTGIGIPENEIKQLLQPFVQLDGSLSRHQEGAGLGLALVYKLTKSHGGSIKVESEVGKGSCFSVLLPWQKNDNPLPKPIMTETPASVKTVSPSTLILLSEDNESNLIGIKTGLQARGYQVMVAYNNLEAIDLIQEKKSALIFMDISMQKMCGVEAIQQIRADRKTYLAKIPIIALTSLALPGDKEQCLRAGANAYLSKPINIKRLVEEIEKQLL
jgi:PAS domain S-box-containing protein